MSDRICLPPAPGNALVITLRAAAEHNLGNDAIAKQYQRHGAQELGEAILADLADPAPGQLLFDRRRRHRLAGDLFVFLDLGASHLDLLDGGCLFDGRV